MEGFQKFRLLDAAFIIGSILTFIADQATGSVISLKGSGKEIPLILRDTEQPCEIMVFKEFPRHTRIKPAK